MGMMWRLWMIRDDSGESKGRGRGWVSGGEVRLFMRRKRGGSRNVKLLGERGKPQRAGLDDGYWRHTGTHAQNTPLLRHTHANEPTPHAPCTAPRVPRSCRVNQSSTQSHAHTHLGGEQPPLSSSPREKRLQHRAKVVFIRHHAAADHRPHAVPGVDRIARRPGPRPFSGGGLRDRHGSGSARTLRDLHESLRSMSRALHALQHLLDLRLVRHVVVRSRVAHRKEGVDARRVVQGFHGRQWLGRAKGGQEISKK